MSVRGGLDAARERGIVHRDLQLSNVKVSDDGTVKVLYFGQAKVFTDETPTEEFSHSPTMLRPTVWPEVVELLGLFVDRFNRCDWDRLRELIGAIRFSDYPT